MSMNESILKIDHLNHSLAEQVRALLSREERIMREEILIDDEANIKEALKSEIKLNAIFVSDDTKLSTELIDLLPKNTSIFSIKRRTCKKIFDNDRLPRIFAIAKLPRPKSLSSLNNRKGDIVVFNNLSISGNIGAIIRTAFALNTGGIIALDGNAIDFYDRRIIRASRGYVFRIPIITMRSNEFIVFCKENSIRLIVLSPHAIHSLENIDFNNKRLAIVLGCEKSGCNEFLLKNADLQIRIPINSEVESLNVSVAASIILYTRFKFLSCQSILS